MPGTRPPMGGPGHVVPPPKVGGTISVVMPLYTIGIVIFFMYTVMKVIYCLEDHDTYSSWSYALLKLLPL